MTDRLTEAEAWLAILDAGSVAAGAQRLGLTPSAASRLLARLESRLGARLAQRTTRSFRPTREGVAFAQEARLALDRLAAAEAQGTTTCLVEMATRQVVLSAGSALARVR